MSEINYPIIIRPLSKEEGGGFIAEFPDLPGCMADGETFQEVLSEAQSALASWVKTAKEFGDPVPSANTWEKYSGQWRIRIPKSLHAALALRAKEEGVSLNMLAATLLAKGISFPKDRIKSAKKSK